MQRSIQRSTEGSSDFRNRSAPGPACLGPGKRGVTRATGQMAMQVAHRVQTSRFLFGQVGSCFIRLRPSPPTRPPKGGTRSRRRGRREDTFSGESVRGRFSRSITASSSNYLRCGGLLICPGKYPGHIKKILLCDLRHSAVKAAYFVLPLTGLHRQGAKDAEDPFFAISATLR